MTQNKEIIDYLVAKFLPFAKEIKRIKNQNDNRENLIIGLNTKLYKVSNAIILSGHIDTVVADEKSYKTNPYVATRIDDKLFGLGAIDMKSYFACILDNIQAIKTLKTPIIIAITGDEETKLAGVENVVAMLKQQKIKPALTIVGEPTNMNLCSQSKSCYEYQIEIIGKGCHSSMPQNGINANYILARIALYIQKLCKKFPDTTLSANLICGGEKINIISPYAKLCFDLRSNSTKNTENVLKKLNNYIKQLKKQYFGAKISISNTLSIPPLERKDSAIISSIIKKFGLQEKDFQGGCEAGYYQALGGDAFVFGVGDLALAHKPNEFVNLKEYDLFCTKFLQILSFVESSMSSINAY